MERTLADHRRANDTVGAIPLLGPVRAQFAVVADLTRSAPAGISNRLIGLAAQYAQFMAWLRIETRDHDTALAWYDRARAWAEEAGNPDMAATTLSMKAHLA
jgi:hypothetical protein